jgi:uncharacterized protein
MPEGSHLATIVLAGGFALGVVFGGVAHRTHFCTMGALSDVVIMGHWGRARTWMLAVAVALMGSNLLQWAGWVDLSASIYRQPPLRWLSLLLGGACFGVGMTLASGCGNKNLVRLGGGSLRSLVVLAVIGISAEMTLRGLFGQWRASWLDPVAIDLSPWGQADPGLGAMLAQPTGLPPATLAVVMAIAASAGLLWVVLKDADFRADRLQLVGGVVLGGLIVGGWFLTGHIGYGDNPQTLETIYFATASHRPESMSFIAPLANVLELLMLWTDRSLHLSYGAATALGVVAGAAASALAAGSFRWEGFASLSDLRRHLTGAVLMGFGGVTALGCTVGQGMSGISTLAVGSLLALAGIVAGSVATLKLLMWRELGDV